MMARKYISTENCSRRRVEHGKRINKRYEAINGDCDDRNFRHENNDTAYLVSKISKSAEAFGQSGIVIKYALPLTLRAFLGKKRDDNSPKVNHSLRTYLILVEDFKVTDIAILSRGLLHDTREDTKISFLKIVQTLFRAQQSIPSIKGLMKDLSTLSRKVLANGEREPDNEYRTGVYQESEALAIVKTADFIDNMTAFNIHWNGDIERLEKNNLKYKEYLHLVRINIKDEEIKKVAVNKIIQLRKETTRLIKEKKTINISS